MQCTCRPLTHAVSLQPHPASAAAAAVLVAHASSMGGAGADTKYNADGTVYGSNEADQMEQGMGKGPLGQGAEVITAGPLVRQQTMGPVSSTFWRHVLHFTLWK